MLLEPQDVELFFKLHRSLMFFVNQPSRPARGTRPRSSHVTTLS
jgi:hypothetical protein